MPPSSCRTTTCACWPPLLREARPDLRLVHFAHTPFATPEWLHMLPAGPRHELLEGLAAHHACGFHTARWAEDFEACCEVAGVTPPQRFVAPLGPDAGDIGGVARSAACDAALVELEDAIGDRSLIVPGRPHRAVQEPAARLRRLRGTARGRPVARPSRVRRARVPVAASASPPTTTTAARSRAGSTTSTTGSAPRPGSRSSTTTPTTSPVRSPPCGATTSCS